MKFHGVDRHKRYWTISQRDKRCQEVGFVAHQWDVEGYLRGWGGRTWWGWKPPPAPSAGRTASKLGGLAAWW